VPQRPPIATTRAKLSAALDDVRRAGKSIGLVPTMGALHEGHLSLVDAARREADFVVATIFVNPTQFGPGEDFERYPRSLERDCEQLAIRGVDLVFAPPTDEIYRPSHATYVEMGGVALPLEGKFRPGHFRGVATVVLKLLNLVRPNVAMFGQKDYQQSLVIRRLVEDFDLPVRICVCPIVRDADGLALSSRNAYLDPASRQQALALSRSLRVAEEAYAGGERNAGAILERMRGVLAGARDLKPAYVVLADAATLEPLERLDRPAVALLAATIGSTRLIDNHVFGDPLPMPSESAMNSSRSRNS
jgi:pantoate--beta-alanine ligase